MSTAAPSQVDPAVGIPTIIRAASLTGERPVSAPATAGRRHWRPRPLGDLAAGFAAAAAAASAYPVAAAAPAGSTGPTALASPVDLPGLVVLAGAAGAVLWLAVLAALGSYRPAMATSGAAAAQPALVLRAGLLAAAAAASTAYLLSAPVPRLLLLTTVGGAVVLTCGQRLALARLLPPAPPWRVVVAAHHGDATATARELVRGAGRAVEVVAVTDARDRHGVVDAVATHAADALVVVPCEHLDAVALRGIGWDLGPTRLLVSSGLTDVARRRTSLQALGSLGLLQVHRPTHSGPGKVLKDCWERAAAATLLVLLAPLLAVLVCLVRWESPGPALFRQTRVGRDHVTFTMLKLRTMRADADAHKAELGTLNDADGVLFKMRADPRITRVGRVLRRYSLDELPQLVNVVLGQMSLVGPRPPLPEEVARYGLDDRRRLVVKPGLTGLWQVSGRSDLSWDESVRLDLSYVDNWSLGLDAAIVGRTVRAVLAHDGAY